MLRGIAFPIAAILVKGGSTMNSENKSDFVVCMTTHKQGVAMLVARATKHAKRHCLLIVLILCNGGSQRHCERTSNIVLCSTVAYGATLRLYSSDSLGRGGVDAERAGCAALALATTVHTLPRARLISICFGSTEDEQEGVTMSVAEGTEHKRIR